jgi:hypothetical protein
MYNLTSFAVLPELMTCVVSRLCVLERQYVLACEFLSLNREFQDSMSHMPKVTA